MPLDRHRLLLALRASESRVRAAGWSIPGEIAAVGSGERVLPDGGAVGGRPPRRGARRRTRQHHYLQHLVTVQHESVASDYRSFQLTRQQKSRRRAGPDIRTGWPEHRSLGLDTADANRAHQE